MAPECLGRFPYYFNKLGKFFSCYYPCILFAQNKSFTMDKNNKKVGCFTSTSLFPSFCCQGKSFPRFQDFFYVQNLPHQNKTCHFFKSSQNTSRQFLQISTSSSFPSLLVVPFFLLLCIGNHSFSRLCMLFLLKPLGHSALTFQSVFTILLNILL